MSGSCKVFTNQDDILQTIGQFQANTNEFWGACVDSTLPSFSAGKVKQGYLDAKKRGVKIMYITEIMKENLGHCKEIMNFAELRHLDGVMGNFALSDTEYIAGIKDGDIFVSLIRTDIKELVMHQRFVFETLWKHAVPASKRIAEIN